MNREQKIQIDQLQNNLSSIRKIAGWTLEELGNKIGVTKQTISNLENKKTSMTLTQYIAIRATIDYEIQTNEENTILPQVVDILLNQSEKFSPDEKKQMQEQVSILGTIAAGGITGAALASAGVALFSISPIIGGIISGGIEITSSIWMSKIQTKNKKE